MQLGAFSVSLAVKDIQKSVAFYSDLGFEPMQGKPEDGWLVMKNGDTVIGLFEGMFDKNMLTFNPGWDQNAKPLDHFTDIRDLQKALLAKGHTFDQKADETTSGPASALLTDPDGNPVFFDQHVPSPKPD